MGDHAAHRATRNPKSIALWSLKIILAIMFVGGAAFKLSGARAAIAEFDLIGLGQWFRYFTAVCEIAGALLLLWPRTTFYGAALMAAVSIGAFVAQFEFLHGDVIHTIVLAAIFLTIAWAYRAQLNPRTFSPAPQS